VIGGGFVGLVMAMIWNALGSRVSIADLSPRLAGLDRDVERVVLRVLRKRGVDVHLGVGATSARRTGDSATVTIGDKVMNSEKVLVAVGRKPNLSGWGFETLGVKITQSGTVGVDENYQTNLPGVFAIGDIVAGPQFAHRASQEGIECVERIAGKATRKAKAVIPSVIYTFPEIASVGITADQAIAKGLKVKVGTCQYAVNSRARAAGQTTGFVKWVCAQDGQVLGMQIVGESAGEAIIEGTIAIQNELNIRQIAGTCHPHPTFSEAVMEAAKAVFDKPIDF
jgi:dihydrolipoamide dehydrogenase